jgi:hypothetical protein
VRVVLILVLSVAGWLWGSRGPVAMACMPPALARNHGLLIQGLIEDVSQAQLYDTIRDLQDDDAIPGWDGLGSRYSFAPGLGDKREYIRTRMEQAGLTVGDQTFRLAGTTQVNLEGTLPGWAPGEELVYILCAHYDSKSDDPEHIAPGADDNASGVAGLLEAARILGRYRFRHTLRFVAFAVEEQKLTGSRLYVQAARAAGAQIGGVINLDMIAWNRHGSDVMEVYARRGNGSEALGVALTDAISVYGIALNPRYDAQAASGNSDHGNFWVEGYSAILVTDDTSVPNPYYHTTGDTVAQLDMVYARRVVQAVVATLAEQAEIIPPELSTGYSGPARATPGVLDALAIRHMAPAWRP